METPGRSLWEGAVLGRGRGPRVGDTCFELPNRANRGPFGPNAYPNGIELPCRLNWVGDISQTTFRELLMLSILQWRKSLPLV